MQMYNWLLIFDSSLVISFVPNSLLLYRFIISISLFIAIMYADNSPYSTVHCIWLLLADDDDEDERLLLGIVERVALQ